MSSILLINPFLAANLPQVWPTATKPDSISPVEGATGSINTPDTRGSDSRKGFDNDGVAQKLITNANYRSLPDRPFEASAVSVVVAQSFDDTPDPFGISLPKVVMPDPLPTSPFLKPANG